MTQYLLGFGASSMQGVGDSQGGFFRRLEQRTAGQYAVANAGIGGNTTRDMLQRLPGLALPPDIVIVLLGCNDLPRERDAFPKNRVPLAEYRENLVKIFSALKAPRSLFISSFLPSEKLTGVSLDTFETYMAAATDLARQAGYAIWDLFHETHHATAPLLAADGLHFNDAGHAFIADRVAEWLSRTSSGDSKA